MQTSPDLVGEALIDSEYPAEKRDLVKHAIMHGARKDVLDDIKNLPDNVYASASDVNRA
ncbi:MAG: hypothetical protein QG646_1010, partial [Euryarchaeota archaeon]|nr:hypothetical protein [Euryarchaeota archaeon]